MLAPRCVAVEDSLSGVGSAANADIGMIVGYVGASHITDVSVFGDCSMTQESKREKAMGVRRLSF